MLTWVLTAVALCALTGVVLVVIALRGRAADTHPICRRCGFDLQGRFPWAQPTTPACPDCGEPLLTFKSVMPGARKRRGRMLVAGCALAFPGLVLLLADAADSVAGKTTSTLKPTSMIVAQVAVSTRASASLRALTGRIADGRALAGDTVTVIERALTLQADRSIQLDPDWLDLLETARRRGQLTANQQERYFRNSLDWHLLATPTTGVKEVSLGVQAYADRLGTLQLGTPLTLIVAFKEGKLGGAGLTVGHTQDPFTTPPASDTIAPGMLLEIVGAAGHRAEAGEARRLATSWTVEVRRGAVNGPLLASWTQDLAVKVMAEEPQPRVSRSVVEEARVLAQLQTALAIKNISLERDADGTCWAALSLRPTTLPMDVIARLRVTTEDGLSYSSTTPVEITPTDPLWTLRTTADPKRTPWTIRVQLDGEPLGAAATVELIPHPSPGSRSLAASFWEGDPLRFEKVELRRPEAAPAPIPVSGP